MQGNVRNAAINNTGKTRDGGREKLHSEYVEESGGSNGISRVIPLFHSSPATLTVSKATFQKFTSRISKLIHKPRVETLILKNVGRISFRIFFLLI